MANTKGLLKFLPTAGILIFVGLYIYATRLYPGGSQADLNSVGFDWFNNYWCNLMSEKGMNGHKNPARTISRVAMVILCSSMILFFFQFANYFVKSNSWKHTIKISGALAMISAMFIFTTYHDIFTTILSICGVLVIVGIIRTLHKNGMTFFEISGIICMLLVAFNNYFYYKENLNTYLPLMQKASFILILAWTIGLNLKMKDKTL